MDDWTPIRDLENYEINKEGKVRNASTGRVLKTNIDGKGYEQISLRKDNKTITTRVHRLMGTTFMSHDNNSKHIIHKNCIRHDNRLENLTYATRSEIDKIAFERGTRKPPKQVRVRVVETGEQFESIRECSRQLGLNQSEICKCINGVAYTCGGLHFERVD